MALPLPQPREFRTHCPVLASHWEHSTEKAKPSPAKARLPAGNFNLTNQQKSFYIPWGAHKWILVNAVNGNSSPAVNLSSNLSDPSFGSGIKGQREAAIVPSQTALKIYIIYSFSYTESANSLQMNWQSLRTLQCAQTVSPLPTLRPCYEHETLIKRGTKTRFWEIYSYLLYFDPNDMKQEKNNFYVVHLYEILHKGFCGYFKNVLKCCLKPHKTMWRTSRQNQQRTHGNALTAFGDLMNQI